VHVVTPAGIDRIDAAGFPVQVYNILGAGDAYAGGVIHGLAHGWSWHRAARLGNACGAIVVTKHGCANFMPTMTDIEQFVGMHGDL
jgi:5-dehydro-2-deoxygluconokinase